MISVQELTVRYRGVATPALEGVSLTAHPGVLTAVVGPNGSGKSTLVRALLGRVRPSAGRIAIDGADARDLTRREVARRVAVVLQREEPAFPLKVRDFVALGRAPVTGAWTRLPERDPHVARAAGLAGVSGLLERATDGLSGGEWQRTRIARALAQDAPALVMDEPTSALDLGHEMEAFELLAHLAGEGRTVMVVSHHLNLVARFAQHVVLLHSGRVRASGPPDHVMNAQLLESVYDCPLVVTRDPAVGAPTLIPLRRPLRTAD